MRVEEGDFKSGEHFTHGQGDSLSCRCAEMQAVFIHIEAEYCSQHGNVINEDTISTMLSGSRIQDQI